jgi:hypothetical protein
MVLIKMMNQLNDMENTVETDERSADEVFESVKDIINKAEYLPEEKRLEAFELVKEVIDRHDVTFLLLIEAVMAVSRLAKYLPQQQQIEGLKFLKNIAPPRGGSSSFLKTAVLMSCRNITKNLPEQEWLEVFEIIKKGDKQS